MKLYFYHYILKLFNTAENGIMLWKFLNFKRRSNVQREHFLSKIFKIDIERFLKLNKFLNFQIVKFVNDLKHKKTKNG